MVILTGVFVVVYVVVAAVVISVAYVVANFAVVGRSM